MNKRIITNKELIDGINKAYEEEKLATPGLSCEYRTTCGTGCGIGVNLTDEEIGWILERSLNSQRINAVVYYGSCPFEFENEDFATDLQGAFDRKSVNINDFVIRANAIARNYGVIQ